DLDACCPFYQPRRVFFGPRRGYVKLALEAGVPVVPVVTIGSHYTWLFFPGGFLLAKILRSRGWARVERVPISIGLAVACAALALALAHLISPLVAAVLIAAGLLPTPVRITSVALPAIDLARATEGAADEADRIERGHAIVLRALERGLATMRHDG